jgi:hypothetical protein
LDPHRIDLEERLERLEQENFGLRSAMGDEARRSVSAARQAEDLELEVRSARERMAEERRHHANQLREREQALSAVRLKEQQQQDAHQEQTKAARGDDLRRLQARRELDEYRASLGLF